MIKSIAVRNFKSLADFDFKLSKFNCLIGMNGAGKSTVLQAIDFIAQLMVGNVDDWLIRREWTALELNCKLQSKSNIQLAVEYQTENGDEIVWGCSFNRHELLCTSELLEVNGIEQLNVKSKQYRIGENSDTEIAFKYQGSILSQLRDSELPAPILEFRDGMRRILSLELLSPNLLRKRARSSDVDIGPGGEKLSAFLYSIKGEKRDFLIKLLQSFYPNMQDYKVSSQQSGWKKLTIIEKFGQQKIETEARHINDGLLRILAILAQSSSNHSLILLDEIENGINPEIVEKLVDSLVNSTQQILVTTHSPMILNYLEDATARESVQFIYKNDKGETRARPFFSIPRIGEKLTYMGPGEAFIDTDLTALTQECVAFDEKEREEKDRTK
ncbi:AAA family ATPase [Methylobacter tundripaludum]|uniref:SMC domain protein n=1 Tax=Methylobacter tundripaludum (strain ATCC BAA-1195 / DSM 17260 / SV96) TaxID=697282 RepID=G3IXI4_METTV|nr:AAA family ATPase [Methylobacter tundripaludum]EGW23393.1 SMC domain protein [Methylobacter tundripaludum SV96]